MKILHITTTLGNGGAEAILYNLLLASPHEHVVISLMDQGKYGPLLKDAGIPVMTLGEKRGKLSISSIVKLRRFIKQQNPDLVQTWMYHSDLLGGVIAWISGYRAIVWGIHNTTIDPSTTGKSTRLVVRCCALVSRFVPRAITISAKRGVAVHTAIGYPIKKLAVIASGYDLKRFSPQPPTIDFQKNNSVNRKAILGCVGRWGAQKDHENLIAACKYLVSKGHTDFLCVLVGPEMTESNPDLVKLIAAHNLNEHFILYGESKDIPGIMNSIDLHVLPSAFGESFPNVVAEAMACGTPCVVTDLGDASWMVGDTGWSVPPKDATRLGEKILIALNELGTGQWDSRKENCRSRALQEFELEKMVSLYENVWTMALSNQVETNTKHST